MTGLLADGTVVCLAGRRIDAENAKPVRFPKTSEAEVRASLTRVFVAENVRRLVCSAACGADIIALEASAASDIPATVVLPFSATAFRRMSVTDRPGDWGWRFDRAVMRAQLHGTLVELGLSPDDAEAFDRANEEIVSRAAAFPSKEHLAVIVWDGEKTAEEDITGQVRDLAEARGFRVLEISTLP